MQPLRKSGFVRALEILENPGKFLKPWKSLETLEKPWNFFCEALENLTELYWKNKFIKWCIFRAQQQASEVTGHSGQWLSRFTGPDSKSTGPSRNRKKPIQIPMVMFPRVFFLTEYE